MTDTAAFFRAVERGEPDPVRQALAADPALVLARDETGATALHVAAFHGRREVVELLLAAGAEINARDGTHGATPAGWAIHYLRERGALLAIEIEDALFAMRREDVELLIRLVTRHPALVDAVDREGTRLATHASAARNPEIGRVFTARRAAATPRHDDSS